MVQMQAPCTRYGKHSTVVLQVVVVGFVLCAISGLTGGSSPFVAPQGVQAEFQAQDRLIGPQGFSSLGVASSFTRGDGVATAAVTMTGLMLILLPVAVRHHSKQVARSVARPRVANSAYMNMTYGPKETFYTLVGKGEGNANMSNLKILYSSIMGGCYVGMAGLLSLGVAGNMVGIGVASQKFIFSALFPVNLLLVLQSGAQLFTGNTFYMSAAYLEERVPMKEVIRVWLVSYIGNLIGCGSLALIASYTGLLHGGTAAMAVKATLTKCSAAFGPTVVKAIMCNWLVCMAVFLATSAKDLTGKMVGIWFPISMFVAIGFEHSVANMFILPTGLLSAAPLTILEVLTRNLFPVTLGNLFAGALIVGAGFSYSQGRLGRTSE